MAGEFAKTKVSEAKESSRAAEEEAFKIVAAAQARWQVAEEEAAASERRAQAAESAAAESASQARKTAWQAQVVGSTFIPVKVQA